MSETDITVENDPPADPDEDKIRSPHTVKVVKSSQGFGFNVRGQVSEGGQLKSIGGELYAPMQYISAVLEGGPAEEAGLKVGDRILDVNGQSVEGTDHQSVVQLIRQSGNSVTMVVVSVTDEEARRLEPEGSSGMSAMDYYERRSVPVSIPDTKKLTDEVGKEYVVYNIYMAGKQTASRRYREFDALHNNLKRQFNDFIFPKLPGKRPFALNDQQVDARRRGVEDYLDKVCSARVIFESDLMQDFLQLGKQNSAPSPAHATKATVASVTEKQVELRVVLPDRSTVTVTIQEFWRTPEVYQAVAQKVNLSKEATKFFNLFQRMEHDFDRRLQDNEFPHQLYLQKYSAGGQSCILLRKWLFSRAQEVLANSDAVAVNLLYHQAVEDISKGKIQAGEHMPQLRMLKAQNKQQQYLDLARSLPDYGAIEFPHCSCDARKAGHVIVTIALKHLRLKACSTEGTPESQEHLFTWDMISNYEADLEEQAFTFRYSRDGREPRWVRVYSPHYRYMEQCVDRINEELLWKQPEGTELQDVTPTHSAAQSTAKSSRKIVSISNEDL